MCGGDWNVFETDDYDLYSEGEHEVTCIDCNHEFEVSTTISYNFQSPKRLKEKEEEEGKS